ncbi:MAG: C4-type zinc ribbon domain-containing protein [Chloracidobacterium sp.]|nr:C4-type zinc ribbon domain-containing protein [Chloracidobacterium sp.]MDW8216192.1 C4-type zinc ribbon domain-containing protein [Acidobacteriota bacterium]
MSQDLELLIALQEIDCQLAECQTRTRQFAAERERLEVEFQHQIAAYTAARTDLETLQRRLRDLEIELAHFQAQVAKYTADLQRVRNQREYETAIREIDTAKKSVAQCENRITETRSEITRLETEVAARAPEIEKLRAETNAALAANREAETRYLAEVETIRQRRREMEAKLSKVWLTNYTRVAKLRGGQAMAQVVNGACSACRMRLRPQVYSLVRQGIGIHTCDSCGRILFYRPEAGVTPSTEKAAAATADT